MSSVLLAAPRALDQGFGGAFVLLALGMGVVFFVLGLLTLLIWLVGFAREKAPAAAEAPAPAPRVADATAGDAVPPGDAEIAAVATALAVHLSAEGAREAERVVSADGSSGAWGSATWAGRRDGAVPTLRRS